MAKQFLANRSGQTPTLDEVPNEVIKINDDKASADLDLANIEENEIVATKAGESEGVVEVVDTVEDGSPNPVSGNAVFDFSNAELLWEIDWDNPPSGSSTELMYSHAVPDDAVLLVGVAPSSNHQNKLSYFVIPVGTENIYTGRAFSGSSGSYAWVDWGWNCTSVTTTAIKRGGGISQQYNDSNWGIPAKIWLLK